MRHIGNETKRTQSFRRTLKGRVTRQEKEEEADFIEILLFALMWFAL
jgi:hypothetical protein